jgi:hypothetical protein
MEAKNETTCQCDTRVDSKLFSCSIRQLRRRYQGQADSHRAEWAPLGQAYGRDYSTSDVTKVVVLGSGTPAADPRHGGISVAVVVNGQPTLSDCGRAFGETRKRSTPEYGGKIAALETEEADRLFSPILHFDHTEGDDGIHALALDP